MRTLFAMTLLALLFLPTVASAEVKTITATHTYIMGDNDSRNDARQLCFLEAKRKVLEKAGSFIQTSTEVRNFQLTKDQISSYSAAVLSVEITKEDFGFNNGHNELTVTVKADVDVDDVQKRLAAIVADKSLQERITAQQQQIQKLEQQVQTLNSRLSVAPESSARELRKERTVVFGNIQELESIKLAAVQRITAKTELIRQYIIKNMTAEEVVQILGQPQQIARGYSDFSYFYGQNWVCFDGASQTVKGVGENWICSPNELEKRAWYEKAAAEGNADAQYSLGWLYDNGQDVTQDYVQARQWYKKAAAQGYARAQNNLGFLYFKGRGVTQDYVQARQWYEKAAAQGNVDAQVNLGVLYAQGQGVPQDYARARQWFEKAAAQGNAHAQTGLGWLYDNGNGVTQDYAQARQWYEKAAAQGFELAQNYLGWLYAQGQGGPQDYVQAHLWLSMAAAQGNKEAAKKRDEVAMKMTPAQIAEAQRLAREWKPKQEAKP